MLYRNKDLKGRSINAIDGEVGSVTDVYFDDRQWTVRYLVVETGTWLSSREVLIAPAALASEQWPEGPVLARVSRKQVEDSPGVDTHQPVSRQYEIAYAKYYGYQGYWMGAELDGMALAPVPAVAALEPMALDVTRAGADSHLRSCNAVTGYTMQARDGDIGHAEDFLIDPATWRIACLVVNTGTWLPGRHVQIEPAAIREVDWKERKVHLALTREDVERAPSAPGRAG